MRRFSSILLSFIKTPKTAHTQYSSYQTKCFHYKSYYCYDVVNIVNTTGYIVFITLKREFLLPKIYEKK